MRIFTERLEYWRFIQEFGFDDKTEEERKLDPGIFIERSVKPTHRNMGGI